MSGSYRGDTIPERTHKKSSAPLITREIWVVDLVKEVLGGFHGEFALPSCPKMREEARISLCHDDKMQSSRI